MKNSTFLNFLFTGIISFFCFSSSQAQAPIILLDQVTGNAETDGLPSQEFPDFSYSRLEAAEDFIVPAGATWKIDSIFLRPFSSVGFDSLYVLFYDTTALGAPGNVIDSQLIIVPYQTVQDFGFALNTSVILPEGGYFISTVIIQSNTTIGQVFLAGDNQVGEKAYVRDPDDLIGAGVTTWTLTSDPSWGNPTNTLSMRLIQFPCLETTSSLSENVCLGDLYSAPSGMNFSPTVDTTFNDTIINTAFCDSVITISLTLLNPSSSTDVQEACSTFDWIDGNTYTASNNTAIHTINNSAGCDSVITLNLTILNNTASSDMITTCDSLNWLDGNTYTSSNNTAIFILTNSAGCDSVITLDLTINNAATATAIQVGDSLEVTSGFASYQWYNASGIISGAIEENYTPTANGTYYCEATDVNSCISTSNMVSFTITTTSIHNIGFENLKIYPNPSKGIVHIESGSDKVTFLQILDLSGRLVRQYDAVTQINVADINTGIYILELSNNEKRSRIKLLIK